MRRTWLLALCFAGVARADPPKPNPRDVFGLPANEQATPLDCSDGRAFGCARATDPLADRVPFALDQWLPARYLLALPVADATHDQVAHYALGAARDEAGPAFGGATGLENRWTIDGAPADDLRTGGIGTRVPLTFLDGIWVTAGGFAARDRASTGGMIDAQLVRGTATHEIDARVWARYTVAGRDRPIADASYQIRRLTLDAAPDATASVVATGPLGHVLGGTAWYAAGIAPNIAETKRIWRASRLVDADGDNIPDGFPGQLATDAIATDTRKLNSYFVPAMARVGLDRGPHHVELTLVGDYATSQRFLANSTLQAAGIDRTDWVGDGIATWRGQWTDTRARVQLAWHRSVHDESAHDRAAASIPQLLTIYVPTTLADDQRLADACAAATTNMFDACPVPLGFFASGGAGELQRIVGDRPTMTGDIAHRIGANVVRAGATFEDTRLVTTSRFTGLEEQFSLFPDELTQRRFIRDTTTCPDDASQPCEYLDSSQLNYRTRYTAAYVEDTWTAAPGIVVDGGLRWELMWVGPSLHFSNELAPRLGGSWDIHGDGTSRIWFSMGRSFVMLPAGVGATVIGRDPFADDTTLGIGHGRNTDNGAPYRVVGGIEPMAQDELALGGEVAINRAVRLTGWTQGRWIVRGLDTTSRGFDNPGRAESPPAERSSFTLAGEVATTPTGKLALRAGYVYNYTVGSWTGAFDPRQGAVLYAGSDYDFTSANQLGRLPTDFGHRVYVEADRRSKLADIPFDVAARLTVNSGKPRNVLANTDIGIIQLLPRGTAGRWPLVTQTNLQIGTRWREIDFTLDVFNAFYRQEATFVDEIYTSSSVSPIEGGCLQDLLFLRTSGGRAPIVRHGYDLPTVFQGTTSLVLGARRAF